MTALTSRGLIPRLRRTYLLLGLSAWLTLLLVTHRGPMSPYTYAAQVIGRGPMWPYDYAAQAGEANVSVTRVILMMPPSLKTV